MFDHNGQSVSSASPSTAVEVLGWRELPSAGQLVLEVQSEKRAHEVVKYRQTSHLEEKKNMDAIEIKKKQEEHFKAYRAQLEHRRKLGRFRMRPEGPRKKEITIDNFPNVQVLVKGLFCY